MKELEDYKFWRDAIAYINSNGPINKVFGRGFVMSRWNYSKKKLAIKVRQLELKLNRPHRYIRSLGCVQYRGK